MASATGAVKVTNEKGMAAVAKVKVQRYWAGKAPVFAEDDDELEDRAERDRAQFEAHLHTAAQAQGDARLQRLLRAKEERERAQAEGRVIHEGEVVVRRRRRHDEDDEEQAGSEAEGRDAERARAAQRRRLDEEAPVAEEEEPEDEDDDARRERLRQLARNRRRQEEEELARQQQEEAEESEYESEYEEVEEDEDDALPAPLSIKPIFVPKTARRTVAERDRREREEEAMERRKEEQAQQRREETHRRVASEIDDAVAKTLSDRFAGEGGRGLHRQLKREMEEAAGEVGPPVGVPLDKGDPSSVDDRDGVDEEAEYELWKLRELNRIKQDQEERERLQRDRLETERRRNMTDAERRQEDALNPDKQPKPKAQLRFLQRYYHKGAFYQDQDVVAKRDFSEPTERDAVNKEMLPAIMRSGEAGGNASSVAGGASTAELLQVKNFGRSGQTKYTHLADQDTTQKSSVAIRTVNKLGGFVGADKFDKPTKSKRKAGPP